LENSEVEELSRIRTDSKAEAHRKTTLALNSEVLRVSASITRIPVALRVRGSNITLWTMLLGRSVIRPVISAAGSVAFTLLK